MWKWTQRSFAGGQQDLTLRGRQDLASYFTSAKTLENFLVKRQGCIAKRRGTNLIASLGGLFGEGKTITSARIIPFVYERSGGYMLLFASDGESSKMFVLSNQGIMLNDNVTFVDAIGDGDTPFSLDLPYKGVDFDSIGYAQSGDLLWVAHREYPFAEISRKSTGAFEFRAINFLSMGEATQVPVPIISAVTGSGFGSSGAKKSIEYVVTAVKDGIESQPSTPFKVAYALPWGNNCSATIVIAKDASFTPDYYNIYKKNSGDYGFIGSTSQSEVNVSTTGSTVRTPQQFFKRNLSAVESWLLMTKLSDNYGYGRAAWCYTDGVANISFNTARYIDRIEIGAGYVLAGWYAAVYPTAHVQLLPCRAVVFDVNITFNDNTKQTFRSQGFSQTYKRTDVPSENYGGPSSSGWTTAINNAAKNMGGTESVSVDIYDETVLEGNKKPVKSIEIIGYADAERTTRATGNFTGEYLYSYVGSPMVLNGVRLVKHGATLNQFEDDYITPDVSLSPPVVEDHFYEGDKYPACVSLQNQRLALAATNAQPFTLWMSTVGDLYNFNTHRSIREDDAIEATIPATEFPEINHIVAAREMLLMCDNGEWAVSPVSGNTLSYSTIQIKQQSQIGCSKRLPPLSIGDEIIFAESTNETLRSIRYEFTSDGYQSVDLSVLSQSLTRHNEIVDYAYKQHPDSIVVCVRKDGTLATLTYMKEHELCAWSTTVLGGGLKAKGVCTDKAIREGTTDLYVLAQKVDGEYILLRVREDSQVGTVENCISLDALQVVTATDETTLEADKIAVDLATGEVVGAMVAGNTYAIGYPFVATFRSIPPEAQGESTIQFEIKGAKSIELRLENASKFKVIPSALEDETDANYWTTCGDDVIVDNGNVTFSKQDHLVDLAGDANTSGAVTIQSDSVWPVTILSYSVNFEFDPRLLGQKG